MNIKGIILFIESYYNGKKDMYGIRLNAKSPRNLHTRALSTKVSK